MACLFLGAKIEEKPKRLREVLNVFYHMYRKRKGLPSKPLELGGDVSGPAVNYTQLLRP